MTMPTTRRERQGHPAIESASASPALRHQAFYDPGRVSEPEARRLRAMAPSADILSVTALGDRVDDLDVVVADLGAGDSTSLGTILTARNSSLRYVPVDLRPDAVAAHLALGFDGKVAPVTDLPLRDGSVDVVHGTIPLRVA